MCLNVVFDMIGVALILDGQCYHLNAFVEGCIFDAKILRGKHFVMQTVKAAILLLFFIGT